MKPALKKVKKAPPQKTAPPPSLPKEDQADKKKIIEQKAREEIIDEKVGSENFDDVRIGTLWNKKNTSQIIWGYH